MNAIDAPLLNAVGALLLPEAGGIGGQRLGQGLGGHDLVDELADHGVLAGANQIQVLALDFIHHGVHVGLAHDALHHVTVDHKRGNAIGEALVDHEIPAIGQHGLVEPGNIAHQIVKSVAGNPPGGVHVDAVEALHDLRVIGNIELRQLGLAEALDLHIVGVIGADGHGGVDHLRDDHHDLGDLLGQTALHLLQLGQPVGVGLHLGLGLLGLCQLAGVLLGLTHQHTHPLGQLVPLGPQVVGLVHGGPLFGVQGNDLVHQGELGVLELLADVFLNGFRIVPDKFDIKHGFYRTFPCFT